MLSLYEILKASKTGIVPDMWTALAGMSWGGADSGHEVKELTGIPPLSFTADGTPLLDYLISGNTVQNDTPTPSNPVDANGVGVRTGNLFDYVPYFQTIQPWSESSAGNYFDYGILHLSPNTTYTFSTNFHTGISGYQQNVRDVPFIVVDSNTIPTTAIGGFGDDGSVSVTTLSDGIIRLFKRIQRGALPTDLADLPTLSDFQNGKWVMCNEGSTILPYEPYGYKIPISSASTTTPVYLGEVQTTRKIKKIVFDGMEENWRITGTRRMSIPLSDLPLRLTIPYCSHFIGNAAESYSGINNGECSISVTNQSVREFGCYVSTITTLADFKTWLQQQYANGTPVTVWYVLATPETATVNEPLMKIGDYADTVSMEQAGVQIPTLHGNTVIDVLTELKPSQMYIKYQE